MGRVTTVLVLEFCSLRGAESILWTGVRTFVLKGRKG
jgi:hypothetical protein